jgi:nonribosomal peptide synthetase DhbF
LEFLGRLDQQVKVRGFRVEPGEIETVLGRHPAVLACAVLARQDRPGDRRLVAYVVAAGGLAPAPGELAAHLRRTLPEHMLPEVFVTLPEMPLSAHGKPDRAALPPPPDATAGDGASHVPPRSRLERQIAALWREVLGVARVGAHDNFFGLGGHSLLLLQAVARMRRELGQPISPIEIFEHPTVAALARHLEPAAEQAPAGTVERSLDRGAHRRLALRQRLTAGAAVAQVGEGA